MLSLKTTLGLLAFAMTSVAAAQVTERQYLSGKDRDSTVPWEFLCTAGSNSGKWTTIPVPSCWQFQGFGNYSYGGDDWDHLAEQGLYRHPFAVPSQWSGRHIFLVFEGSMTDTDVRLNGKSAGPMHKGAFYRFKYDVTNLVKVGASDNLLEVTVSKHSVDDSVNRAERMADYWAFGGIFRPVYLEAVPSEYIDRIAIDAKADGSFSANVVTRSTTTADTLEAELFDASGKSIATIQGHPGTSPVTLKAHVENIATWTAETPHLYTATIRLKNGQRTRHEVSQRFGFRTMEVRKGDGLYLNGRRIVLKGVCRHAFWPDTGRTLSATLDRQDLELMKEMNLNAVRMTHYPPDQSFLDLCDELGMYVLDELSGWQKAYDTEVGRKLLEEMIVRDVNHPSIVLWDNGNEGGWNTALDDDFAKWDPQHRAVLHPWALHDDVNTKHYPDYSLLTQLLVGRDIVMPTEFLHGLYDGGAGSGFRDYWDAMRASKVSAGGFFWVWADEGAVRTDDHGRVDVVGNAAPDGITGPYRQKEASFFTIKKIWSPVVLPDQLPADFDGQLAIENTYNFTALDRIRFTWQLRNWGTAESRSAAYAVVAAGNLPSPQVEPGEKGVLAVPLPAAWKSCDALAIEATDWTGRKISSWVWPLKAFAGTPNLPTPPAPAATSPAGELRSGDVLLKTDPRTGVIQSITRGDKSIMFTAGPRLTLGASRDGKSPKPTGRLVSATWFPASDGWFRLDYSYEAQGPCEFMGITFDLPEKSVQSARWLGAGPYRVWKNRLEGPTLGVWEHNYNNTVTGWSGWQYPEFKGYFADLHWAKLTTDNSTITILAQTPGLFLHLLTPEWPPDGLARTATAPFPDGSISLLHGIPAMGTKFDAAEKLGPQSQLNQAHGTYQGIVWFRFQ